MATKIQILRRVNGAAGSPAPVGFLEGEILLNFPGAAGSTGTPEFWGHDGAAWRRINPPLTTQSIAFGTTGANVGAGYAAWAAIPGNALTGQVIIGTWGSPAQAYVLTAPTAPNNAANWTSLGGAVSFANANEIHAGADTTKAINSAILRGETKDVPGGAGGTPQAADADYLVRLDTSGQLAAGFVPNADAAETLAGMIDNKYLTPADLESRTKDVPGGTGGTAQAADANYLVKLNTQGYIDSGFLNLQILSFKGSVDMTAAPPNPAWNPGDFGIVGATGTANAGWNALGITGAVNPGDLVVKGTGATYDLIATEAELRAYVSKAGKNAIANDMTMTWTAPAAPTTIIDGGSAANSRLDNVSISCGTF